jgi:hypothetical protein
MVNLSVKRSKSNGKKIWDAGCLSHTFKLTLVHDFFLAFFKQRNDKKYFSKQINVFIFVSQNRGHPGPEAAVFYHFNATGPQRRPTGAAQQAKVLHAQQFDSLWREHGHDPAVCDVEAVEAADLRQARHALLRDAASADVEVSQMLHVRVKKPQANVCDACAGHAQSFEVRITDSQQRQLVVSDPLATVQHQPPHGGTRRKKLQLGTVGQFQSVQCRQLEQDFVQDRGRVDNVEA